MKYLVIIFALTFCMVSVIPEPVEAAAQQKPKKYRPKKYRPGKTHRASSRKHRSSKEQYVSPFIPCNSYEGCTTRRGHGNTARRKVVGNPSFTVEY